MCAKAFDAHSSALLRFPETHFPIEDWVCFQLGFFALGNLIGPIEHALRFSDVLLLVYALLSQLPIQFSHTGYTKWLYTSHALTMQLRSNVVVAIIAAKAENIKSNRLSNLSICSHGHKAVEYALFSLHSPLLLLALNGAPLHSA